MDWTQITLAVLTPTIAALIAGIRYLVRRSGREKLRLNAKIEAQQAQIFDLLQQRIGDEIKRREATDETTRLMRELLAQQARLTTKGASS